MRTAPLSLSSAQPLRRPLQTFSFSAKLWSELPFGVRVRMGLSVARLGFLSAAAVLLLRGGYTGSSSHSLHIFYTLFVDSSQDGTQYIVVVYVDDQLAARFDPTTRRMLPQVAWLLNVREEDSYFLDAISQEVNSTERKFKSEVHVLHIYHNSSRGFHSWQNVIGCELSDEGQKQGTYMYGYDGEPFISLDQKTLSWIAVNVQAQVTKRRWEAEPLIAHSRNDCLENKCIELLQKCVMYGKDSLLRKEPPVAKVTRGIQYKGLETLICRAYSFYPKEVNITWRKDGEVWEKGIFRAGVLPNSDGTYHAWLSIEVDPKEKKDHYRCYVEHAGLSEPLIVALEESGKRNPGAPPVILPFLQNSQRHGAQDWSFGGCGGSVSGGSGSGGCVLCDLRRQMHWSHGQRNLNHQPVF